MKIEKFIPYFLFFVLICVALFSRIYQLDSVPQNLHPDSLDALRLYLEKSSISNKIYFTGENSNGSHVFNNYLLVIPWEISGRAFWGMRISPVIISILTISIFFLAAGQLLKKWSIAFISTLLIVTNPWLLNFSRSGWENIANSLGVVLLVLAYSVSKKHYSISIFITTIVTVISPYLYHPGKIVFIFGLVQLFYLIFLVSKKQLSVKIWQFLLLAIFTIVCVSPFVLNLTSSQFHRIQSVYVGKETDSTNLIIHNVKRSIVGVVLFRGKEWNVGINSRYLPLGSWVLNPILIPLFAFGFIYSCRKSFFLSFAFIFLFFPINILSLQTPDAARSVHVVPLIFIFIGYGVLVVINTIDYLFREQLFGRKILIGLLFTLIVLVSVSEWQRYWIWINQKSSLRAREPAVYNFEYQNWLEESLLRIKEKGVTESIGEWRSKHPNDDYYLID